MGGALVVVYAVALLTAPGRRLDVSVFERVSGAGLEQVDRISSRALDTIDVATVLLAGALLFLLAFARRRRRRAAVAFVVVAAAIATTEALKPLLGLLGRVEAPGRPYVDSFPSGHATVALSIGCAAVIAAPRVLRPAVAAAAAAYATIIGVALVALASHLPSDVLGGYLVAGAWAAGACSSPLSTPEADDEPSNGASARRVAVVLAVCVALGCLVTVAAVIATHAEFARALTLRRTLLATAACYAAASMAIVVVTAVAASVARS
jgi:hypothetical protein